MAALLLRAPVQALPQTAIKKAPVPTPRAPEDVRHGSGGRSPSNSHGRLGDFDAMRKRRLVRVLVVYNKTNYFIDRGTPRGIAAEAFKLFEDYINQKYKTGNLRIHVAFIPTRRDALASALLEGKGDIAAAYIMVTPERLQTVDFSSPTVKNVSEIVVGGASSPPVAGLDDLSGREVFVRKSSLYNEDLEKLNADLVKRGKAPVKLRFAPDEPRGRRHPRDGQRRPRSVRRRGRLSGALLGRGAAEAEALPGRRAAQGRATSPGPSARTARC